MTSVHHTFSFKLVNASPLSAVPGLVDSMLKWGLTDKIILQEFNYTVGSQQQEEGTVAAPTLRFHSGLAESFLKSFFASEAVQRALPCVAVGTTTNTTSIQFDALTCTWTTLAPFDRLCDHKVTRRVRNDDDDVNDNTGEDHAKTKMLPVSIMEKLLPSDVLIADEVRSLFLDTYSARTDYGGVDEDDEDEDDYYSGMRKLTRRVRKGIFSVEDRKEFLYHIVWRLVAGGGSMNQYEDDFEGYRRAARDVFRLLVKSLKVDCNESDAKPNYTATILSHVYEVKSIAGCNLFPSSDSMSPSNLNYLYVIVNPAQQSVMLWHHAC